VSHTQSPYPVGLPTPKVIQIEACVTTSNQTVTFAKVDVESHVGGVGEAMYLMLVIIDGSPHVHRGGSRLEGIDGIRLAAIVLAI
jgi:hypothetical protein